jgi:hypothetical protein
VGKRLWLNENQYLVMAVAIVMLGLIYLIAFHEEPAVFCSSRLSPAEAADRGCPVSEEQVRLIIRV